ncbi:CidA/LrgA family protein [Aneurinibacillus terranovensis]|uniref:CidA/LrgA family protein n=1 Tax=Aneurinibacillus terranovensis TaxID=278991 RepID=UPI0004272030|nr:CidA/LrgA family protein [Aneurinibacillus terranovensis]
MKKIATAIWQICLLIIFSFAGNYIANILHLKISGSIIGVILVFFLLYFKVIRLDWLETGANWLLAELLLFFVPSAVGIVQYKSVIMLDGSRFMLVIVIGTLTVMACTGLSAEFISRRRERNL